MYTAASGMLVQGMNTDILANNLANVDTAGYRRQSTQTQTFPELLLSRVDSQGRTPIGTLGAGATITAARSSFTMGSVVTTGNPLDVCLNGHGFFTIETSAGNRYTRDGRFTINEYGWLTSLDGHRVLGEQGPIRIQGNDVVIESDGSLKIDGESAGRLLVVEFLDRDGLVKEGSNLFSATEFAGQPFRYQAEIVQGSLEMANVNVVTEMVNMIQAQRAYESSQKVIQAYDETLGKAVNEIAKF